MQVSDLYYKKYLKYKNKYLNLQSQIGGFENIEIKKTIIDKDTTEISFNDLNPDELNLLINNVKYLTNLKNITLTNTSITDYQVNQLVLKLEKINITLLTLTNCTISDYIVNILKQKFETKLLITNTPK